MNRPAGGPGSLPARRLAPSAVRRTLLAVLGTSLLVRALVTAGRDVRPALRSAREALAATRHASDLRWETLRPLLPPRGRVQYLWSLGDDTVLAYQAQFSLAPLVLTLEPAPGGLLLVDPHVHRRAADLKTRGFRLAGRSPEGISVWQKPAR